MTVFQPQFILQYYCHFVVSSAPTRWWSNYHLTLVRMMLVAVMMNGCQEKGGLANASSSDSGAEDAVVAEDMEDVEKTMHPNHEIYCLISSFS